MTSSSTTRRGQLAALLAMSFRSLPAEVPASTSTATAVRSGRVARRPKTVDTSPSMPTTTNSSKHAGHGELASSPRTTEDGDRWSNAASPGSSPTATGVSATAVSAGTARGCSPESQPSTSVAWSTSASPTTTAGRSPDQRRSRADTTKDPRPKATSTTGSHLDTGSSIKSHPSPRSQTTTSSTGFSPSGRDTPAYGAGRGS